jgi:hypothetical protein
MTTPNPLESLAADSRYVMEMLDQPAVLRSTVRVWSDSPYTGTAEGEVWFVGGIRLRLREELDFDVRLITAYGYEVYRGDERLFWYDDFPHPLDAALAATHPHHKHVPPDIKHHRVPAAGMSFAHPNLSSLMQEITELVKTAGRSGVALAAGRATRVRNTSFPRKRESRVHTIVPGARGSPECGLQPAPVDRPEGRTPAPWRCAAIHGPAAVGLPATGALGARNARTGREARMGRRNVPADD